MSRGGVITIVSGDRSAVEEKIERLIAERAKARVAKDWKESDRIRDKLAAMGVTVKDGRDPNTGEPITTWEIAR